MDVGLPYPSGDTKLQKPTVGYIDHMGPAKYKITLVYERYSATATVNIA